MEDTSIIQWVVVSVGIPLVGGLSAWIKKLYDTLQNVQQERIADLKETLRNDHDAITTLRAAAEAMKDSGSDQRDILQQIQQTIMACELHMQRVSQWIDTIRPR